MGIGNHVQCTHPNMLRSDSQCPDCGTIIIEMKRKDEQYSRGFSDGFNAALRQMREMVGATHQPGRVPEDAIEHRNGPKFKDSIETKNGAD
jgi:hypothetical protein